jgi:PKD repeat protein
MEYSYCSNMFTAGQVTRMRNAATSATASRNNLWTVANLSATGVNPVGSACAPIADFGADKTMACTNSPITFTDLSWNGQPTTWSWSFPGGTPSTSTDSIPVVTYAAPGTYSVTFTVGNAVGTSAPVTKTSYITIRSSTATYQTGWQEGFETSAIPNADWTVVNPAGVTWTRTNLAAATGTYSMYLKNTTNTGLSSDDAISPSMNFSALTTPSFKFKVAYAQKNSSQMDFLKVYSSINCGQSWTLKYSKYGQGLQTLGTGVYQSTAFTPTASQWRTETVPLGSLGSQQNVIWKFTFICDSTTAGNNIYIDDINLTGAGVGIDNEIENTISFYLAPNPSNGQTTVNFTLVNKMPVKVDISDMLGRKIETLANSNYNPGEYKLSVGDKVNYSRGIYFVNLQVGDKIFSQKMLVE